MTTDVISGVPMEQIRAALTKVEDVLEAAYHNAYPECCGRAGQDCCGDAVQAWSEADQKIMDVLSPIRRGLSDILATAQPVDASEAFCDGNCTWLDHHPDCVRAAQPAADGEREVWAVPVLDGEKKTTFYTEQLPFVPGIGVKQLGEPVRMVEARAAQPQQAVAVTDEVRRLRERISQLEKLLSCAATYATRMEPMSAKLLNAIDAALAAHKTGEEE